jgi:phosphoglycerate kinase
MKVKTLDHFNTRGKTILVRADLNSEVVKGKVTLSERIIHSVQTIKELQKKGARVIVIAHQGSPEDKDFISLAQHARHLRKFLRIRFVNDVIGKKAVNAVKNLKHGEAILLENIRFEKDEFYPLKKHNSLIETLVPLVDAYVNDAFSVSHRTHTSLVSFPRFLPSFAGRLFEQEFKAIQKISLRDSACILGGVKPEDNLKLLKGKKILTCGMFCHLCLIAKGYRLGAQEIYLRKSIKNFNFIIQEIKKHLRHIITPVDLALDDKGKRKEISLDKLPVNTRLFDIGTRTILLYKREIRNAKTLFVKGPSGLYTDKKFMKGTREVLKAISKAKAFSVIGGGHSNEALNKCHIDKKKFGYVSLSGGALIQYLAGEKLPGIEALEKSRVY